MFYFYISIIVILVILLLFANSPIGKGKIGEFVVSRQIGKDIPGVKRKVNNILFAGDKRSAQIDHVVVNEKGIFVIETKNYGGRIYGSETDSSWTQVLAYGRKKYKFYNPLKQNYTHVAKLHDKLGAEYQSIPIYSIVVFIGRADITHLRLTKSVVTTPGKLRKSINKIGSNALLNQNQIETVTEKLYSIKNSKDINMREHIKSIKKMQMNIDNNICPRCGGKLVVRCGVHGKFLGCENYPKCNFRKKLNS